MDFLESTWFKSHGRTRDFPTPEYLRTIFKLREVPRPVKFEDLGHIVKFGSHITTTEAINQCAIRRVCRDTLPVSEVHAWRILERQDRKDEVFIYMQLIEGPTLQEQWPEMSATDKQSICSDLRTMVSCLRSLQDSESQQVIGKAFRQTARTYVRALEARVEALEKQLALSQRESKLRSSIQQDEPSSSSGSSQRGSLVDPVGEVTDTLGKLCIADGGEIRFFGSRSNFNLMQAAIVSKKSSMDMQHEGFNALKSQLPPFEVPRDLYEHLLDLFWTWQNPWQYFC